MKKRRGSITFFLALALFLGLAFWQRAFFITYLIKPIAGILWFVYRTFLSVDQEIYWGALFLIALLIIPRMIFDVPEKTYRTAYHTSVRENDPVAYWKALLENSEVNGRDRLALEYKLESLRRSIGSMSEEEEIGEIHLPPVRKGFQQRVRTAWRASILFQFLPQKTQKTTELEEQTETILKFLETQLEMNQNGTSNHANDD